MPAKTIEIDTRQQKGMHEAKHQAFRDAGYRLLSTKLPFGDYRLVGGGGTYVVDTKRDLLELCQNLCKQHKRFRSELSGAHDAGYRLFILVENADGVTDLTTLRAWRNPRTKLNERKGLRPPLQGDQMAEMCKTMERRYGCRFLFCAPQEAGAKVIEILESERRGAYEETASDPDGLQGNQVPL